MLLLRHHNSIKIFPHKLNPVNTALNQNFSPLFSAQISQRNGNIRICRGKRLLPKFLPKFGQHEFSTSLRRLRQPFDCAQRHKGGNESVIVCYTWFYTLTSRIPCRNWIVNVQCRERVGDRDMAHMGVSFCWCAVLDLQWKAWNR